MNVKFWFLNQKYLNEEITKEELMIIESHETYEVLNETEKASYIEFYSPLGTYKMWIPKSCITTTKYKKATIKAPDWLVREKNLPSNNIKGYIVEEREKAIYFRYHLGLAAWLPKSQIEIKYD